VTLHAKEFVRQSSIRNDAARYFKATPSVRPSWASEHCRDHSQSAEIWKTRSVKSCGKGCFPVSRNQAPLAPTAGGEVPCMTVFPSRGPRLHFRTAGLPSTPLNAGAVPQESLGLEQSPSYRFCTHRFCGSTRKKWEREMLHCESGTGPLRFHPEWRARPVMQPCAFPVRWDHPPNAIRGLI